ncbi:MAG: metallophosphoesterase [Burkholderiales bacterium]
MTLLVQISDPHFGTEQAPVVEALTRFVDEQSPSIAILSGDITQRARRSQFRAARAFIDRLGVPTTLVIPGNHDIPLYHLAARVAQPYAEFQRAFGRDLEPAFEADDVLVLTLNTTRAYLHERGAVSPRQIERVARRFERAGASQLRIVVTHQPVSVTRAEDRADLLHGHARAVRRWAAAGADLILGGHIHLPFVQALHEAGRGLPRAVWAVQAGTAVSSRVRNDAGNSVNLIRCAGPSVPRRCSVERWDYDPAASRFALAARNDLVFDDAVR